MVNKVNKHQTYYNINPYMFQAYISTALEVLEAGASVAQVLPSSNHIILFIYGK